MPELESSATMPPNTLFQEGIMKERFARKAGIGFLSAALALSAFLALPGCSQDEKITETKVIFTVIGFPGANGHHAYAGLASSDDNLLAINSGQGSSSVFTNGSIGTQHFFSITNPSTEYKIRSDSSYKVAIWIDMNDNVDAVSKPETGIDYITNTYPIIVESAKEEVSLGLTANSFHIRAASDPN
jgi:hypothetical protein